MRLRIAHDSFPSVRVVKNGSAGVSASGEMRGVIRVGDRAQKNTRGGGQQVGFGDSHFDLLVMASIHSTGDQCGSQFGAGVVTYSK